MTPVRVLVVIMVLLVAVTLAVASFAPPPQQRLSDDDYISIALSDPQVFRPRGPGSGGSVTVNKVERTSADVIVQLTVDGIAFQVTIDPRTNRIRDVVRRG